MPKTMKDKENEFIEVPLVSELNFWEFDEKNDAIIYVDGSMGAGCELSGIDNECDSDEDINQRTLLLRGFLNSLPEGILIQLIYKVDSNFSDVILEHDKKTNYPLIDWISEHRVNRLGLEQNESILYRPRIYLFFRFWPKTDVVSKIKFFEKKKEFGSRSQDIHEKLIHELNQKASDIEAALTTCGVHSRRLGIDEIKTLIYEFLNPERSELLPFRG